MYSENTSEKVFNFATNNDQVVDWDNYNSARYSGRSDADSTIFDVDHMWNLVCTAEFKAFFTSGIVDDE